MITKKQTEEILQKLDRIEENTRVITDTIYKASGVLNFFINKLEKRK